MNRIYAAPKAEINIEFREDASTTIINLLENETSRNRSKTGRMWHLHVVES
jgi:hypothetical protein